MIVLNPPRVLVLQVCEPGRGWDFLAGVVLSGTTRHSINTILDFISKVPMDCGVSLRLGVDPKTMTFSRMIFDGTMGPTV